MVVVEQIEICVVEEKRRSKQRVPDYSCDFYYGHNFFYQAKNTYGVVWLWVRDENPQSTSLPQITNHTVNLQSKADTMMMKGNPFKEDQKLVALLQELDSISTRRHFRRWKKSFLAAFEIYLDESGSAKVRASYRQLCHILSRHVELVKKMHAHIQCGDLSPEGCTVRSRQTLGNFFDQMIRVKQILIDLLPTTARMEKQIGYTKFHLAAVLIDNGFISYDRLSLCDEIHFHFKKWCLQDVANKLFLLEMDHYHNQLDMFCDILADLGLKGTAQKCLEFLHLDDEETILWEGEDDTISEDGSLSESESDGVDLDPLPDLSDITFEDDDSLNMPLWKVNNFYKDNAELAERFRQDMKRKSFDMFNGNSSDDKTGGKPPNMPRRSNDGGSLSPPPPSKPQRRLSNGTNSSTGEAQQQNAVSEQPGPPPSKPQRRLSNGGSTTGVENKEQKGLSVANPTSTDKDSPPPSKPRRRLSNGLNTSSSENKEAQGTEKTKQGKTADLDETKRAGNRTRSRSQRFSSRTIETADLSDSDDPSESEAADTPQREEPRRPINIVPPTSYLPMPKSKISHIEPKPEKQEHKGKRNELERQTSFYSFANYYHGSPSDWRVRKADQWCKL